MIPTRRSFLAAAACACAAGCRRPKGSGFEGRAFVANEGGRTLAVVDLTSFSVIRHIGLGDVPGAVLAHPARPAVYALTPRSGTIHEVDPASLAVRRTITVAPTVDQIQLEAGGDSLWALARASRQVVRVALDRWEVAGRVRLNGLPAHLDVARERGHAAVTLPAERKVVLISLEKAAPVGECGVGPDPQAVIFRKDGRQVITGNRGNRTVSVVDVATRRLVVHLPLAVAPERFCAKDDGGGLFVTGAGLDAVAMIFPYRNMVAETMLAGRSPGAMAASAKGSDLLLVANTLSGDVTVIDIATARVVAMVAVGATPTAIAVTPDDQYALVLNRDSGDMAVIRLALLRGPRGRGGPTPLFTMIRVGTKPVGVAVKAV